MADNARTSDDQRPSRRRYVAAALIGILLLAAVLRFVACDRSPQGLQVDEASDVWNAWCLLHLGVDEHGDPFPIFYNRSFGDNRSPLYLYLLMPFQAVAGMSVCTAAAPAALGGVVAVALIFFVSGRMFGPAVGLLAAVLLAIDPWHLQQSRWGHQANITPTLVLGVLALLLWAGWPFSDRVNPAPVQPVSPPRGRKGRKPAALPPDPPPAIHPWLGLVAGLVAGAACYGYAAIRIFLPLLLIAMVILCWPAIRALLGDRAARQGIAATAIGFALTFTPLLAMHLFDDEINVRARTALVWDEDDPLTTRIAKSAARYPGHFGPDFLFINGSRDPAQSPPDGFGQMHWYMLPLLLIGAVVTAKRLRTSRSARLLAAGVLLYPASDLFYVHDGMNALRTLPGLPFLVLLGAVGAAAGWQLIARRSRAGAFVAAGVLAMVVLVTQIVFLWQLFGPFNDDPDRWRTRNMDLKLAVEWLNPRFDHVDAVFVTQRDRSFMYAPMLVFMQYNPEQWFDDARERMYSLGPKWAHSDLVYRFGKVHFMFEMDYVRARLSELRAEGATRIVFITEPHEMPELPGEPELIIHDPAGEPALWIYQITLE